jgi:hypothetical protein
MRDWLSLTPDSKADDIAKSGAWNSGIALRAIAESIAKYVTDQKECSRLPTTMGTGAAARYLLRNGFSVVGTPVRVDNAFLILNRSNEDEQIAIRIDDIVVVDEKQSNEAT